MGGRESLVSVNDVHATILKLLGLEHERRSELRFLYRVRSRLDILLSNPGGIEFDDVELPIDEETKSGRFGIRQTLLG